MASSTTTKAAGAGPTGPAIVTGIVGVSSVAKANIASIDGILNGKKWSSSTLTYSFPTIASTYEYSGEPGQNFQAFNDAQKAAMRSVLAEYSAVANLHFVEVTESSTNHATLRFAESDAVPTAYTYYPAATAKAGDIWFNTSTGWYDNPVAGNYAYLTMLHEVGHSLGLKHAQDTAVYGALPTSLRAMPYTVMSYQSYVGAPITGNYTNQSSSYAQTLMSSDILAIQKIYGANYATNAGNTVYSWTPDSGSTFVNGVAEETTAGNKIFHTIWDGGGNDTYDFSAYTDGVAVDLNPGAWSTASQAQLANLSGNGQQMAPGNIANAYLFNKSAASLIENAVGGSGNDTIIGNAGANTLTGGDGNDTLNGGAGADHMLGGQGNDVYVVDNAQDLVDESDGNGFDTVQSSISFDLSDTVHVIGDVENLTLTGSAALHGTGNTLDNIIIGNSGANLLIGLGGADHLDGGAGTDTTTYAASCAGVSVSLMTGLGFGGDAAGDTLVSIENLTGSAFDDTLEGSAGNNILVGGAGIDTVSYEHATNGVTVSLAVTKAQSTGGAGRDTLSGFENLTGSNFNDTLTGTKANNTLTGLDGNDTLNGGAGADHMSGGSGSDTYLVDNAGDVVDESGGDGIDTVRSSVTFSLSDTVHAIGAVENLTLTGSGAIAATGNALNNILNGNSGANTLAGLDGDDTLNGGGGNDRLIGGAGHDVLTGGAGRDTFVFNSLSEIGDTITDFKHGQDRIEISGIGFDLSFKTGALDASYFDVNGTATHAGPEFFYDKVSHTLFFDSDGAGACHAVEVAHLTNNVSLIASDIWIV